MVAIISNNRKKAKEAKRKQHVVEVKSLRLSPIIDTHDFETKVRQTSKNGSKRV